MFLNDSFEHFGRAGVVPNGFGVHDRNWTLRANPQAIGFGSVHERFRADKPQFLKTAL